MKNRNKKTFQCALIAILIAIGAYFAFNFWQEHSGWPTFPDANPAAPSAPQIVVQVPRDYGWRTGDAIPIDLYIRQMPGTAVDTSNIAISGDFEVRTQPDQVLKHRLSDGSELIKLHFCVQSFNVSKSWKLDANMTYKLLSSGDAETVSLPGQVVYTSMTYDGRQDIQQGPLQLLAAVWDIVLTFVLIVVGLGCLIWGIVWHGKLTKRPARGPAPRTQLQVVQHNVAVIFGRIREGDLSAENYEQLERNLRWLYKLEPKTRGQIELEVEMSNHPFQHEIITIVTLCDKRIYDSQYLNDEEHKAIAEAFQRIFIGRPAPRVLRNYAEDAPVIAPKKKD